MRKARTEAEQVSLFSSHKTSRLVERTVATIDARDKRPVSINAKGRSGTVTARGHATPTDCFRFLSGCCSPMKLVIANNHDHRSRWSRRGFADHQCWNTQHCRGLCGLKTAYLPKPELIERRRQKWLHSHRSCVRRPEQFTWII